MDSSPIKYFMLFVLAMMLGVAKISAAQSDDAEALLELSMEDLMQVEVTTASRLNESRKQTPASVTVLTQEDIQRSGVTSLPELLRLVPGLNVARLNANKWSVSARGFGGRFANKLLVQVDGVSIYSPLFSGTFWEAEQVMLEDIERVEVVIGPGGATWGANAVNGTINVITKSAKETGNLLRVGGGSEDPARLGLRYTEHFSDDLAMRVSSQYLHRGEMDSPTGGASHDDYELGNVQLRLDWEPEGPDSLTFIARALNSRTHESFIVADPLPPWQRISHDISLLTHGNVMLQWKHEQPHGGDFQLQTYLDHWDNDSHFLDDLRHVIDIEAQWRRPMGDRVEWVYGGGVRHVWDDIDSRTAEFDPESDSFSIYDAFASMSLWAVPDRLRIVLGARAEFNDYTGFEIEPSVRATWTPAEAHTLWAAASRGIRVPSRTENHVFVPNMAFPGIVAGFKGSTDLDSEVLLALEAGYRYTPRPDFAIELALFSNHYDKLRTLELSRPRLRFWEGFPVVELPLSARNNLDAQTAGGTITLDWRPRPWWRLRSSWAYLDIDPKADFRSLDIISLPTAGDTPRHTITLWNSFDITKKVTLDSLLQYTDRLDGLGIDDYVIANLRLGWRVRDDLLVSITGTNLLEGSHLEYASSVVNTEPAEIERGIYAEVSWEF